MYHQLLMFCWFHRNHRLEVEATSLHDSGDYTFVLEGYSQSLSAKIHIIGTLLTTVLIMQDLDPPPPPLEN